MHQDWTPKRGSGSGGDLARWRKHLAILRDDDDGGDDAGGTTW
jgi:hypothetical protein